MLKGVRWPSLIKSLGVVTPIKTKESRSRFVDSPPKSRNEALASIPLPTRPGGENRSKGLGKDRSRVWEPRGGEEPLVITNTIEAGPCQLEDGRYRRAKKDVIAGYTTAHQCSQHFESFQRVMVEHGRARDCCAEPLASLRRTRQKLAARLVIGTIRNVECPLRFG